MANRLPTALPRRPTLSFLYPTTSTTATTTTARYRLCARPPTMLGTASTPFSQTPARHATIIRRPRRPYEFTQLVQLSDGSTYTRRTASPLALYRSTKDSRNHVLWQPSEKTLRNVEVDEAGRLAAFRGRFGRGWDAEARAEDDKKGEGEGEGEGESEGEGTDEDGEDEEYEEDVSELNVLNLSDGPMSQHELPIYFVQIPSRR